MGCSGGVCLALAGAWVMLRGRLCLGSNLSPTSAGWGPGLWAQYSIAEWLVIWIAMRVNGNSNERALQPLSQLMITVGK